MTRLRKGGPTVGPPCPTSSPSGATATLALSARAPAEPGRCWIEVDVVEDGVRWLKDDRSEAGDAMIAVLAAPEQSVDAPSLSRLDRAKT